MRFINEEQKAEKAAMPVKIVILSLYNVSQRGKTLKCKEKCFDLNLLKLSKFVYVLIC